MAEKIASGSQLLEAILRGEVPRQVRMFAAEGLLPVTREQLFRIQAVLSADPDEHLAETAAASMRAIPEARIGEWLQDRSIEPLVLDLLVRIRREETVWAAVARHPEVSNETLRVLARHGGPLLQDIIVTNQVRLLACLELLEDLRENPKATQVVLRRVREFEEEFIAKAIAAEGEIDAAEAPTVEEALAALRGLGAHIPGERDLPYAPEGEPELEQIAASAGALHLQLGRMKVKDQIMRALKGSREDRSILVNSRNRLVVRAVLGSPKLSPTEIEKFASSRSASDEVLRLIVRNRRWMRQYPVVLALVENPKTPLQTSLRILPQISPRDLRRLTKNTMVNRVVRTRAEELLDRRR